MRKVSLKNIKVTYNCEHIDSLMFTYDPSSFKHYVGTYVDVWTSSSINLSVDSTVISIDNGDIGDSYQVIFSRIDNDLLVTFTTKPY